MFDSIKEETLVVTRRGYINKFLKRKTLSNVKYITLDDFLKKYLFSYDELAIYHIMKKYNIKYEVAIIYLKNIYYIKEKEYKSKKLSFLKEIKEYLLDNNLLIVNDLFKEYIKNIKVIFYDIKLNNFLSEILKDINYEVVARSYNKHNHNIIEFNTEEEEIEYVAYRISELLNSGISINKIKLTNVNSDYYNVIERIFSLYNLKIQIPYETPLSSFEYIKDFLKVLEEKTLEESIDNLDVNNPLYNELLNVINKSIIYPKEIIIDSIKRATIRNKYYTNSIEIIDYLEYIADNDEYIFLINFNDKVIPNSIKDISYITDDIKEEVGLITTKEENINLREEILNKLMDITNLEITYKLKDNKKTYYISTLSDNFNVIKKEIDLNISYSEKYNKLKLAKSIDNYIKYGIKEESLKKLSSNFKVNYNSYDNTYHKIDRIQDKLVLSYSKMNIYNKCQFRYYIDNILNLNIYEDNFSTVIGSLIHYVLNKTLENNDNDISKYICEFLKDKKLNSKEKFFLNKYTEYLDDLLNEINEEKKYMSLDKAMYEKEVLVEYPNNVIFKGIIDKILYKEELDKTVLSIVDYKTGHDDISLKYLKEGIDIQLPIYLFLSEHLGLKNILYSGFYLQKLNIGDKDYRLEGYSNSDKEILSYIDNSYDNSKIIKGLKAKENGEFYHYSKTLNNEEINKIIDITKETIASSINKITNNEFNINPKRTIETYLGCDYCKYKDLCFVKNKDYIIIKEEKLSEVNN